MPEPSLVGELGIALSRVPLPAILGTIHTVAFWCIASFVGEPVGFASPSCLVADPSCLSTHTPEDDVWTNLVDRVSEVRNIIICRTIYVHGRIASAVVSVTTVGTIKPHFKLVFAILCQLRALAQENIVYIFLSTVVLAVSIPWRNIEAVLHTQTAGCLGKVAGNVGSLAILIAGIDDGMVSSRCRPEAETVMMLDYGDTALHASSLYSLEPLSRVWLLGWCKKGYVFTSESPFSVGIGIHAIMEEGIEFCLLPFHLAITWNREHSCWLVVWIRQRLLLYLENTLGVASHGGHDEGHPYKNFFDVHGCCI